MVSFAVMNCDKLLMILIPITNRALIFFSYSDALMKFKLLMTKSGQIRTASPEPTFKSISLTG